DAAGRIGLTLGEMRRYLKQSTTVLATLITRTGTPSIRYSSTPEVSASASGVSSFPLNSRLRFIGLLETCWVGLQPARRTAWHLGNVGSSLARGTPFSLCRHPTSLYVL